MSAVTHIFLVFVTLLPLGMLQNLPLVHLENGAVQGVYVTSAGGRKFSAFRGIPYARPPTGKYRFREPSPIKRWPGVWNASEYGSSCLQYEIDTEEHVTGSEDCLFINIFTPKLFVMDSSPHKEVLVFIHGKTFMFASGLKHDPTHLMDNDVVVVSFNYRLGILGFLSTEDNVAPGNYGLKDQNLALHWIQKNIASFGGNPMKVIIAGSLAGGASVHYHYFSPKSQGLFHGGMSFGGTALSPWAQSSKPRIQANRLSELLGCSTYSSSDLIDCLRYRPARQIVQQAKHFLLLYFSKELGMIPMSPFGPTIEVMGNAPFISKNPGDSLVHGAVQDLPWVVSTTVGNGLDPISVSDSALHLIHENFKNMASIILGYNYSVANVLHSQVSENIHKFYFENISSSGDTLSTFEQMLIDRLYTVDIERAARLMASVNSAPVYMYDIYNKDLKRKLFNLYHEANTNTGILVHNEIEYIEPTLYAKQFSEEGRSLFKLLTQIFVKFVQTGNPTLENGITWLPLVPNYKEINFLNIINSTFIEMKSALELGNRKFWDSLPLQDPSSIAYKVKMFSHASEL